MDPWTRPLSKMFPKLARQFEPLLLADLPTAVQRLEKLESVYRHPALYVKRDDLSSKVYGGNKVRKLEFILGDAKREGTSTLVTMGGSGSNHLLATALHGREHGMRTVGIIFDQPDTENVRRNKAADKGVGVELIKTPSKYLLPIFVAAGLAKTTIKDGKIPRLVAGGGSSPLGALGFVNAGLELSEQVANKELPEPRYIYVPYGTGGTAAGLSLGLSLGGLRSKVIAVRVIDRLMANMPRIRLLAKAICRILGSAGDDVRLPMDPCSNIKVVNRYFGSGYGYATSEAKAARKAFKDYENIDLELVYTAKAAAAFFDGAAREKEPLLFWHTFSSADISKWVAAGSQKEQ
jgi:D-cysteine desulfhydrase